MMTSLIFDAHAIIAYVRAVTELPGLMICRTVTGGALLGANQEHERILCLLLLLLFQFSGPTVIAIFYTYVTKRSSLSIIKALHRRSHQFCALIINNILEAVSFVGNSML
jgi:hypothetical protein